MASSKKNVAAKRPKIAASCFTEFQPTDIWCGSATAPATAPGSGSSNFDTGTFSDGIPNQAHKTLANSESTLFTCSRWHLTVHQAAEILRGYPRLEPKWLRSVVVEWLYYSKRIIVVRWADLSEFFFRSFSSEKCVFLFHVQRKLSLFFRKTVTPQNGLLIFLGKETHSETKSWKSSRNLTKKVTTTTVNPGNRRGFCV